MSSIENIILCIDLGGTHCSADQFLRPIGRRLLLFLSDDFLAFITEGNTT